MKNAGNIFSFASNGSPLENEYNPIEAGAIAAGSSFDNAWDQTKGAYYKARQNLANAAGNPVAENDYRQKMAALLRDSANKQRLYKPLADSFPYATGIGEALPAVAGVFTALGNAVGANVLDRWLQDVARVTWRDPDKAAVFRRTLLGQE
jgi:hypothetical protein